MQPVALPRPQPVSKRLRVAVVTWLAILGLDFLLNGALFARMYQGGGPFMLPPAEAFRRIPLGYMAFFILAVSIVEIVYRLGITRITQGMLLGFAIGGVFGATWGLSLYSIASIQGLVALAFVAIWFALCVLASAVAAVGLAQPSLRGLAIRVAAFDVLCAVTVIALQSFGVVPTLKL
jgi:hypothetical protein